MERKKEKAYCPKNGGAFSWLENHNHTWTPTSRLNVYLNALIRSKLDTPIGKTKTKKIGEQIKKEKELTLVHCC